MPVPLLRFTSEQGLRRPFPTGVDPSPPCIPGEDWAGRVADPWGATVQVPECLEPTAVSCAHPSAWSSHPWPEASPLDLMARSPVGPGSEAQRRLVLLFQTITPAHLLVNPFPLRPDLNAAFSLKPFLASLPRWGFFL